MIIAPIAKTGEAIDLCKYGVVAAIHRMNKDYKVVSFTYLGDLNRALTSGTLMDVDFVVMNTMRTQTELRAMAAYKACMIDVKHFRGPSPGAWQTTPPQNELMDPNCVGDIKLWTQYHAWVSIYTHAIRSPTSLALDQTSCADTFETLFVNHLPPSCFPPPLIYSVQPQTGIFGVKVKTRGNIIYGNKAN